jgi:hypothetical protein
MRVLMRFWGHNAAGAFLERRLSLGLQPETYKNIGYIRDALLSLAVIAAGMYLLENPDKFDAVLDWMLGRHGRNSII